MSSLGAKKTAVLQVEPATEHAGYGLAPWYRDLRLILWQGLSGDRLFFACQVLEKTSVI